MSVIDDKIAKIEQIIDYTFKDKLLCAEALQMDGGKQYLSVGGMPHNVLKNKNLEAVGDAIIDAVLCKLWYEFRDNQGGRLTVGQWDMHIRQRNACNDFFTRIGRTAGIDACIIMNRGMFNQASDNMVANTVEAIVGAAYVDAGEDGLHVVRAIMTKLGLDNPPLFTIPGMPTSEPSASRTPGWLVKGGLGPF